MNAGSAFSVEIDSKKHVKKISLSDDAHDRVFFERNLGKLLDIPSVEGDVLEFVGSNGVWSKSYERTIKEDQVSIAAKPQIQGRELHYYPRNMR